jgi:hypothetical protein
MMIDSFSYNRRETHRSQATQNPINAPSASVHAIAPISDILEALWKGPTTSVGKYTWLGWQSTEKQSLLRKTNSLSIAV